jgi:hypothetical protein
MLTGQYFNVIRQFVLFLQDSGIGKRGWDTCTTDSARMLHNKYFHSRLYLENDFARAARVYLTRLVVPCDRFSFTVTPTTPLPSLL